MGEGNEGIIVSGGTIHGKQITVGRGAQAIQTTYCFANDLREDGKEQLADALTELLSSIEAHKAQIADYDEVLNAVQQIAHEAKKNEPSKLTLKGLLGAVKESVSSIADIVEKIGALRKAVTLTMGIPFL